MKHVVNYAEHVRDHRTKSGGLDDQTPEFDPPLPMYRIYIN